MKNTIMKVNNHVSRYNNNNDCFIHIRLTDAAHFNPGLEYYIKVLSMINFDKLFIASDDFNHPIIYYIYNKYNNNNSKCLTVQSDEVDTIHFGSTCKHIVLSHGSFSAIIGYLGFFSNIYYPEYENDKMWYGDMFSIDGWNKVSKA
jgi:hypothetical protein